MSTATRKVLFNSENEEYKGVSVLIEKGSPVSYLGDRKYVVSEDDCIALKSKNVAYTQLG